MQDYFEAPESVEARAIMHLVYLGEATLEDARDLIGVPDRQQQALDAFLRIAGKDGKSIGSALAFRRRVLTEFEKLVEANHLESTVAH